MMNKTNNENPKLELQGLEGIETCPSHNRKDFM
jgi:hypothetical protein